MRGRRPKPTRLKMLTGNPGKRPLNARRAAARGQRFRNARRNLDRLRAAEWDRLVGELAALRMLTNLDRAALAAYCGAYALWAEATEAIQKYGAMVKSPTGLPDPVALSRHRQPAGRDHDADRVRVRLHAGEPEPDFDASSQTSRIYSPLNAVDLATSGSGGVLAAIISGLAARRQSIRGCLLGRLLACEGGRLACRGSDRSAI